MKIIRLGGKKGIGKFALIDDADFEMVNQYKWHLSLGYVRGNVSNQHISLHRFLLNSPKDKLVDHINHDLLDNRRSNLRICTNQQNCMNRQVLAKNKSGFKGVYKKNKNTWAAEINTGNKKIYLGTFLSPELAGEAYQNISQKIFGEFAWKGYST